MPIINMVYKKKKGWKPGANTLVCYDFENDSGTTVVNKGTLGSNLNATSSGVSYAALSSGKKIAQFSSNNGGIKSNGIMNMPSNFTVIFWIKGTGTGRQGAFGFYGTGENNFWFNADGYKFNLYSFKTSWVFAAHNNSINVLDGNWHCIYWVYNGTTNKVYVDNVEVSLSTTQGSVNANPIQQNCYINVGKDWIGNNNWSFIGQCGGFIVENKARTAQEIADYYNLTKGNYGIS